MKKLALLLLLAVPLSVEADDASRLEGKMVAHAGEIEKIECPSFSDYDCTRWPDDLYSMSYGQVCFEAPMLMCGLYCTGMLAVDRSGSPTLYTVERSRIEEYLVTMVRCPRV